MNTGGQASERTLRDEFAGQALQGFCANPELAGVGGIAECAYDHADAMLAEKARREAVVQGSSTTHDDGKVAELQAANKELVEALDNLLAAQIDPMGIKAARACKNARAILAKHKGAK